MNRVLLCALVILSSHALAQNAPESDSTNTKVVVIKLTVPTYPASARQARIAGAVMLDVTIRANGGVESVAVISGHPMLIEAAMNSARKTEYECRACNDPLTHYLMTYKFELGDTIYCTGIDAGGNAQYESYHPQVTQSQGSVTIVDRPVGTCDPSATVLRIRSAKCLFLWRCSKRYPM